VALAPTGTALAEAPVTVPGKAYGNCGHSSAGGNHHTGLLRPEYNKGNGGLVELAKAGKGCLPTGSTGFDEGDIHEPPPADPAPPVLGPVAPR
jgi:hypothetical protein